MTVQQDNGFPVKIDVSASAKLEVKAEIPTRSVGGFVDALTDLIRPWSETRGLKADLIRLHREEVAFEIATRARRRLANGSAEPKAIPLKILIPILEKGSQEEADDDYMINLWADLLAASSVDPTISPRFVSIISEINSNQAKLLRYINNEKNDELIPNAEGYVWRQRQTVENFIQEKLRGAKLNLKADELASELLDFEFKSNGTYLAALAISSESPHQGISVRGEPGVDKIPYKDLEVLKSLGLLERIEVNIDVNKPGIKTVSVIYYRLAPLALEFLELVSPSS